MFHQTQTRQCFSIQNFTYPFDTSCNFVIYQQSLRSGLNSGFVSLQMEFNPSKCKIVTISHKSNPPQRKYVVCGVKLEQGGSFPYLGVTDQYQAQVVSPCFHDRS